MKLPRARVKASEGDDGRARGDRGDGVADDLAAGRRAEAGGEGERFYNDFYNKTPSHVTTRYKDGKAQARKD